MGGFGFRLIFFLPVSCEAPKTYRLASIIRACSGTDLGTRLTIIIAGASLLCLLIASVEEPFPVLATKSGILEELVYDGKGSPEEGLIISTQSHVWLFGSYGIEPHKHLR